MTSNRRFAPRGSLLTFSTHLLLTLLTLCLLFEILRLLTFTSATPIKDLTHRRDDSGPNDASIYQGLIDSGIESSETSKRDFGENVKAAFEDLGDTVKSIFNPGRDKKTPAEYVSEYAYNELDHQIPLQQLKESFEKKYNSMKHSDHQMSDEDWVHDQVKKVIPELKKKYDEANKSDSASRHHERDAGDKPKPKPGTPEYYTDPSFFPYPMPLTPNITEELKVSLGNAFNEWRANVTGDAISKCSKGLATCNKAEAITSNRDPTPKDKRKEMVEACIKSLIDDPSCLAEYQSTKVLKPYLTELVDRGTIKDIDGVIKKFYKHMVIRAGGSVTPELALSQNFKDMLANAFKKYKEDVALHSDMSCPMTKENTCENPSLVSGAGYDMSTKEREHVLGTCIVFLSWHPNCLQKYETKDFIKPYLEDLADHGKIDGYAPGSSTSNAGVAQRRGMDDLKAKAPTATAKLVVSSVPLAPLDPSVGRQLEDSIGGFFGYYHEPKPSTATGSVESNSTAVQPAHVHTP